MIDAAEGEGESQAERPGSFANAVLEPIHNRMPVIVPRQDWEEWFSPGELAPRSFLRITTPYRAEEMSVVAVSPLVNSARVDDPRCCRPGKTLPIRRSDRKSQETTPTHHELEPEWEIPDYYCCNIKQGLWLPHYTLVSVAQDQAQGEMQHLPRVHWNGH